MKTNLSIFLLILFGSKVYSQATSGGAATYNEVNSNVADYASRNVVAAQDNIRSDVSVNLSKDFSFSAALNIATPVEGLKISLTGELGSTNKYTPLFDKGKWGINTTLGAAVNYHVFSHRSFFNTDIAAWQLANVADPGFTILNAAPATTQADKDNYAMDNMPESLQSQFSTAWISVGAKYNYKSYLTLKDSLYPTIESLLDNTRKSDFQLKASFNGLKVFSTRYGIQLKGSIGYTFNLNSSNYEDLSEVKVSQYSTITDTSGNSIKVSSDESSARKGKLEFSKGHTIEGDLHFTISNSEIGKVAIDIFAMPKFTINESSKILNLQAGINFGILKNAQNQADPKSSVNIGIAVDFKNLTKQFSSADDYTQRIIPKLIIGIPIPTIGE